MYVFQTKINRSDWLLREQALTSICLCTSCFCPSSTGQFVAVTGEYSGSDCKRCCKVAYLWLADFPVGSSFSVDSVGLLMCLLVSFFVDVAVTLAC